MSALASTEQTGIAVIPAKSVSLPVTAAVAKTALEQIRSANGDVLTPASVVDAAKAKDHPLHHCFTWDNTRAAEVLRELQALVLIRSVTVKYSSETNGTSRRGSVKVSMSPPPTPRGYVESPSVDLRTPLDEAIYELTRMRMAYGHLPELVNVFKALDDVVSGKELYRDWERKLRK